MELDMPKFVQVLDYLNGIKEGNRANESGIARELNVTYSHVVKLLNIFSDADWVSFDKRGRNVYIDLTPSGKLVAGLCSQMLHALHKANSKIREERDLKKVCDEIDKEVKPTP